MFLNELYIWIHLIAGPCNCLLPRSSVANSMDVLNRSRPICDRDVHHRARYECMEAHLPLSTILLLLRSQSSVFFFFSKLMDPNLKWVIN